jgi:hypothetical protein
MARHVRNRYTYEDNYTEEAYIAPLVDTKPDGGEVVSHPEVRFTYKPMTVLDHAKWQTNSERTDAAWYRSRAAMLAERIVQ